MGYQNFSSPAGFYGDGPDDSGKEKRKNAEKPNDKKKRRQMQCSGDILHICTVYFIFFLYKSVSKIIFILCATCENSKDLFLELRILRVIIAKGTTKAKNIMSYLNMLN